MNSILLAVLLVAGIGLIAGVGLSVASVVMAVPTDETADAIRECLPGANCALERGDERNEPLRARRQ